MQWDFSFSFSTLCCWLIFVLIWCSCWKIWSIIIFFKVQNRIQSSTNLAYQKLLTFWCAKAACKLKKITTQINRLILSKSLIAHWRQWHCSLLELFFFFCTNVCCALFKFAFEVIMMCADCCAIVTCVIHFSKRLLLEHKVKTLD